MSEKRLYALTDTEAEALRALARESATTVSNYALDALTPVTVDEAMVERAARAMVDASPDSAHITEDEHSWYVRDARAALDAALNTEEGA